MITFNFNRIFKAKGIDKPFTFLTKAGFSDNFATKVKNNKIKQIGLYQLEKLCIALRCTPNDLFNWIPDEHIHIDKEHPLHGIRKTGKVIDIKRSLNSITIDELEEIDSIINKKRKASVQKASGNKEKSH